MHYRKEPVHIFHGSHIVNYHDEQSSRLFQLSLIGPSLYKRKNLLKSFRLKIRGIRSVYKIATKCFILQAHFFKPKRYGQLATANRDKEIIYFLRHLAKTVFHFFSHHL